MGFRFFFRNGLKSIDGNEPAKRCMPIYAIVCSVDQPHLSETNKDETYLPTRMNHEYNTYMYIYVYTYKYTKQLYELNCMPDKGHQQGFLNGYETGEMEGSPQPSASILKWCHFWLIWGYSHDLGNLHFKISI